MIGNIEKSDSDEFKYLGSYHGLIESVGYSLRHSLVNNYRRDNVLEAAEVTTRFEVSHIEEVLGSGHWILLLLRGELASVVDMQGRTREAEKMKADTVQRSTKALGRQNPDTLDSMSRLVSRYVKDGKLEDAEKG